jgi:hypothetical protein
MGDCARRLKRENDPVQPYLPRNTAAYVHAVAPFAVVGPDKQKQQQQQQQAEAAKDQPKHAALLLFMDRNEKQVTGPGKERAST